MKPVVASEKSSITVYFDGACPVCTREIAAYRRQEGAETCEWIDASTCEESALGSDLPRQAAMGRFHVRLADGSLVDGTRAFATLWRSLPRLAWAGRIAAIEPLATLLDGVYAVFLKVRPLWQAAPRSPKSWIDLGDAKPSTSGSQAEAHRIENF